MTDPKTSINTMTDICDCMNRFVVDYFSNPPKCDSCDHEHHRCICNFNSITISPTKQFTIEKICSQCRLGTLQSTDIFGSTTSDNKLVFKHFCNICHTQFFDPYKYPYTINQHPLVGTYNDLTASNSIKEWTDRIEYQTYKNIVGDRDNKNPDQSVIEYCKPAIDTFLNALHTSYCNHIIDLSYLKHEDIAYIAAVILYGKFEKNIKYYNWNKRGKQITFTNMWNYFIKKYFNDITPKHNPILWTTCVFNIHDGCSSVPNSI